MGFLLTKPQSTLDNLVVNFLPPSTCDLAMHYLSHNHSGVGDLWRDGASAKLVITGKIHFHGCPSLELKKKENRL